MIDPLSFAQIIWLVVALVGGIVAVTFSVRFNVTKYLRDRRDRQKDKLKIVCPHVEITDNHEGAFTQPTFSQLPDSPAFQCWVCGFTTHQQQAIYDLAKGYEQDRDLYVKRQRQANALCRKLYGVKAWPHI